MSDFTGHVIKNRIWVDHDRSALLGPRILVLEWWAFFWVSVFAVWITVWAPQYWKLIKELAIWITEKDRLQRARAAAEEQYRDSDSDWGDAILLEPRLHGILNGGSILATSHTAEEGVIRYFQQGWRDLTSNPIALQEDGPSNNSIVGRLEEKFTKFWQNLQNVWGNLILAALGFMFCGAVFIVIAAAATAVVHVELDNTALSDSPTCGAWLNMHDNKSIAFELSKMEERAATYYKTCYEAESFLQECNLFSSKTLQWKRTDNDECPFRGNVCLLGAQSALTFDTGYVDSKVLGLNARQPRRPYFRRRTSCAPVVTDGYIRSTHNNLFTHTRFYYGPNIFGREYTWEGFQMNQSYPLLSPAYLVDEVSENEISMKMIFSPVEDFKSAKGYTKLFFFQQVGLAFDGPSDDPIFPARQRLEIPNRNGKVAAVVWVNGVPRATVLGCTDIAEVCSPSLDHCIDAWTEFLPKGPEMMLLKVGMLHSGFGGPMTRTGQALDASSRIVEGFFSMSLRKDQWKFEVQRLFQMSLIHTQMEILELAQGTRSKQPGFTNSLNLGAIEDGICQMVKFKAKGYKNLSFLGIMVATLAPPLLGLPVMQRTPIVWLAVGARRLGSSAYPYVRRDLPRMVKFLSRVLYGAARFGGSWLGVLLKQFRTTRTGVRI